MSQDFEESIVIDGNIDSGKLTVAARDVVNNYTVTRKPEYKNAALLGLVAGLLLEGSSAVLSVGMQGATQLAVWSGGVLLNLGTEILGAALILLVVRYVLKIEE